MKHPGKVFTKQQIYEQGWGDTYVVADNNINGLHQQAEGKT